MAAHFARFLARFALIATATVGLACSGEGSGGSGSGGVTGSGGSGGGGTPASSGGSTGSGGSTSSGSGGSTSSGGSTGSGTGGSTSHGGSTTSGGSTGSGSGGSTADAATRAGGTGGSRKDAGVSDAHDARLDRSDAPSADAAVQPSDGGIVVPPGYELVWADEFDVDGKPDPKSWTYEKGFARNNELQWYQPDNASIEDGLLVIEGRKERVPNPNYKAGSSDWKTSRQYAEYTSTSMITSGLQTWQYGRFEMRARIPTSAGMWPAWWTLGVSGEWPSNGEIDIMEFYSGKVLANVACGTSERWKAKWDSATKSLSSLGANWSSAFHVWRMDWDDQKIDLFLDDTLMNSATLSSMLNADGTSPFKQKVYMLVNLAIGGDNGGDPAGTTFPVRYEVDYIRVFQKR